jgi:hypothetical protein
LKEIAQELAQVSTVEQAPAIEGRGMSMMLIPSRGKKKPVPKESADEKSALVVG